MKRGPRAGTLNSRIDPLAKARQAWGDDLPPEIEALARACRERTAVAVAAQLGVSGALISHLLARNYPGDVALAFAKIRGAFLGEEVDCPILGPVPTTRCLDEQKRPFAATNSIRARLYHACRTCPQNRKRGEASHG